MHLSVHSQCSYFKLLLTSYLKRDIATTTTIILLLCLAISMRAKVLHDPLVQYSRGLNWYGNIDELVVLARGGATLKRRLSCSPITTHWESYISFFRRRAFIYPELIESFVSGWGERYCNNANYVKNNVIFEPPKMRARSSTPPKQNQDFVKEHNRTPFSTHTKKNKKTLCLCLRCCWITIESVWSNAWCNSESVHGAAVDDYYVCYNMNVE